MEKYKFLQHTADMKFQAFGKNITDCYKNAAYALKEIITKDKIKPVIKKTIKVKGKDYESLLYNFLEEFLFLLDSKNLIMAEIGSVIIKKDKNEWKLIALIYFDNIKKYKAITDIKAITYNDMWIKGPSKDGNCLKDKNIFKCQVVVDV